MALANTTDITFGSTTITKATDFNYNVGGAKLDNTGLEDAHTIYEIGITDISCTINAIGDWSALAGTSEVLTVGLVELGTLLCEKVDVKGVTKGQITSAISFKFTTQP